MIVASGNANKSKTSTNDDDHSKTFELHREHERTDEHIERVTTNMGEGRPRGNAGRCLEGPRMAQFFPYPSVKVKTKGGGGTDDHATTDRTAMPDMRDTIPLTIRGVDELVWRETNGFPRACRRHAAVAISDPQLQPLRVLRR
jgi:hypothetical protein